MQLLAERGFVKTFFKGLKSLSPFVWNLSSTLADFLLYSGTACTLTLSCPVLFRLTWKSLGRLALRNWNFWMLYFFLNV